jgi:malate permease and related proteins
MNHILQVSQTVLAFAAVVLLCVFLKYRGAIKAEHGPLFARLLTQVVLPVVIFSKLATHPIGPRQLLLVASMIVAVIVCLGVSWGAGRVLRLDRAQTGALMIASAFGSSTLIGYPLIQYAFPHNPEAMIDAILISELGVGLPIFTLCVWVAMYFGEGETVEPGHHRKILLDYFRSPIFISLAAGLLISPLHLNPESPWLGPFFQAADMVGAAIALLACLILAIELDLRSMRHIWLVVVISAAIQMGLHPLLAGLQADFYHFTLLQREVLVLEAAMPSAILGVVFATRYRCAAHLNAALVFGNILISLLAVPLAFGLLSR